MTHSIRQLEERHVSIEINILRWNDRMDLLALANIKGEVSLHRLAWQRVWCLRSEQEGRTVTDMIWRPDGKILAVAYSSDNVVLVEVENKNILHTINIGCSISCIDWQQDKNKLISINNGTDKAKKEHVDNSNESNIYLMDLPSLASEFTPSSGASTENYVDLSFVKNQNDLNILLIGTESGCLHVSIFGLFTCAIIDISAYLKRNCKILKSQMSDNLSSLFVTIIDENSNVYMVVIDSSVISLHSKELFSMAMKHVHLISLLSHLEHTMSSVTEAWESILLEMDSKLSKYASNVPEGTVCADFLDLLMFGIPSDEMEEFLMQDLTDKGLKKLGHSIELSYSNIQKLLLTHMNTVGQNITYHLAELRGMARLAHRYKNLGLNEETVTSAIMANGAFLVKGVEVQQVINHSMSNYKAFFKWLYVVILRLMDEQIPPEIPKMTQQDLLYITEFLQNFDSITGQVQSPSKTPIQKNRFNLERLGQYLLDAPLTILPNKENNMWSTFLEENECFAQPNLIIKHYDSMSLVQQQKYLAKSIHDIFLEPKTLISNNFTFKKSLKCMYYCAIERKRMSQINYNELSTLMAVIDGKFPANGIHLIEINNSMESCSVRQVYLYCTNFSEYIGSSTEFCKILDVQFYTTSFLSVLIADISENNSSFICQVPIANIREHMVETIISPDNYIFNATLQRIDICNFIGITVKAIEGMSASCFAVSGTRHVSVVLSDNKHKVQLFEMEADEEEEEDETEMTINNTQDSEAMLEESIASD